VRQLGLLLAHIQKIAYDTAKLSSPVAALKDFF